MALAKATWRRLDKKTKERSMLRAIAWGFLVLLVIWLFGFTTCYLSMASDILKFLGGAVGIIALIYLLSMIFTRLSHPMKRPTYLIVLGMTLMALTLIVQSVPGEPICSKCLVWGADQTSITTCRANVIDVWFGDLGFIWGVATALFGVAWRYLDKREEEREKVEKIGMVHLQ